MKIRFAFGIGVLLVATGCGRSLSESECQLLLDHYTDKLIDQSRPSLKALKRQELIEQARKKAATDPEFAKCPRKVRRAQFECAMLAGDADSIERCLLL